MFLQAALLLVRTLKTVKKPDLAEIGALADLRAYFTTQESVGVVRQRKDQLTNTQTLSDILVEELHNHIYLKTFYSESRWRSYAPGQTTCACERLWIRMSLIRGSARDGTDRSKLTPASRQLRHPCPVSGLTAR